MDLTNEQKSEMFSHYHKMALSIASKFSVKYHLSYDDLADEAVSLLSLTIADWGRTNYVSNDDPRSGTMYRKFDTIQTTWIYQCVYWELLTFCTRKRPRERVFADIEAKDGSRPVTIVTRSKWIDRVLNDLGEDARIVLGIILDAPADIVAVLMPRNTPAARARTEEAVKNYVSQYFDWEPPRIDAAWVEIAAAI